MVGERYQTPGRGSVEILLLLISPPCTRIQLPKKILYARNWIHLNPPEGCPELTSNFRRKQRQYQRRCQKWEYGTPRSIVLSNRPQMPSVNKTSAPASHKSSNAPPPDGVLSIQANLRVDDVNDQSTDSSSTTELCLNQEQPS
jgi:hypothetical protein